MAQRLPTPGSDNNSWGDILNGFLGVSLNADGTIKSGLITTNEISSSAGITKAQLASTVQASLTSADTAVHTAGTETITGDKTFSGQFTAAGTTIATTQAATDASTAIATTAFVRNIANVLFADVQTMVNNINNYNVGTVVAVNRYIYQSSPLIEHNHSMWYKNYSNQWQPVHGSAIGLFTSSGSISDGLSVLNSIGTIVNNNSSSIYMPFGTEAIDNNRGTKFRFINGGWKTWEYDWITWTNPNVTGLSGSLNADPGWGFTRTPEYRYTGGRVTYRGTMRQTNGSMNGNPSICIQLPITARPQEYVGTFLGVQGSSGQLYMMSGRPNGQNYLALDYWSPPGTGQYAGIQRWNMYGNTPIVWNDGSLYYWDMTYDQA